MNKTIEIKVTDSIVELKNVFVGNHGIIYDNNGDMINRDEILSNSSDFGVNNHIKSFLNHKKRSKTTFLDDEDSVKKAISSNSYRIVEDDNYIHLFHFFNLYVWGHFWDSAGLLDDFENVNINFKLAISQITDHVCDIFKHFELLGYKKDRIVSFPNWDSPYLFPTLFVNKFWVPCAHIKNKKWFEKKYIYDNSEIEFDKFKNDRYKLFLSRSKYNTSERQILNEDIIWEILKNKGYVKLYGDEGLIDHIKYFMNAEKIITAHGSLVRNMTFCLRDPEIWEFFPAQRLDMNYFPMFHGSTIFKSMAKDMGLKKYFFVPVESDKKQNIILDPELIHRIS
jgi:hypothetical protein